ncbi:MAG: hypothetical protein WD055_01925 [Candidatus Dependentiae bacterium]
MSIVVSIIEEDGELVKEVGLLEDVEISKIAKSAKLLDLKCLPFLDPYSYTYYNELQANQILKEIPKLKQYDIPSHVIDILEKGALEVSKGFLLLKFEGE